MFPSGLSCDLHLRRPHPTGVTGKESWTLVRLCPCHEGSDTFPRAHPPLLRAHPQPLQNPGVERAEPKAKQTFPMGPAFLRDEVCCLSLGRMTAWAVIPWLSIPKGMICTLEGAESPADSVPEGPGERLCLSLSCPHSPWFAIPGQHASALTGPWKILLL